MKMEQTECSETSVYKIQTPDNYPKESIQRTEHGESLKLRISEEFQVGLYVDICDVTLGIVVTSTIFKASMKFIRQEQETS